MLSALTRALTGGGGPGELRSSRWETLPLGAQEPGDRLHERKCPKWGYGGGCSQGTGFRVPAPEWVARVLRGPGLGSSQGHSPSPGPGKPLAQRGGAQAPRCRCAGFLTPRVDNGGRGLPPQLLLGERLKGFVLELGGLKVVNILLQALRVLEHISGCSRGPESSDKKRGSGEGVSLPWGCTIIPLNSPGPEGGLPQLRPLPESARILCPHEWIRALRLRSVASEQWAVGEAGSKRTEG